MANAVNSEVNHDEFRERMVKIETKLENHERRNDEFMKRTDDRLEELLVQSSEWSGVRKTLAVLVTLITIVGSVIGWAVHEVLSRPAAH